MIKLTCCLKPLLVVWLHTGSLANRCDICKNVTFMANSQDHLMQTDGTTMHHDGDLCDVPRTLPP